MQRFTQIGRREFLRGAAGAAAAMLARPETAAAHRAAPSDRIRVGVIGLGSRGFNLIADVLAEQDAQLTVLCDVDRIHYRDRPWGKGKPFGRDGAVRLVKEARRWDKGLTISDDYREVCGSDDVDAVIVATPDHWHALITLEAVRCGKDVYCEKPVTHTFAEGRAVCSAVKNAGTVFQTGSQQRSSPEFQTAVELVRNGVLGTMKRIEIGLPPGYDRPQGSVEVTRPPATLDYDAWCGPAPLLPYMRARHHRWWRGHRAFGGGVLMDWIGHHNDIAHWALGAENSGPLSVEAVNWTYPETDVYNTAHHYEIHSRYAGDIAGVISSRLPSGTKFIGSDGWVFVTRGRIEASDDRWLTDDFDPGEFRIKGSSGHMRNFLDCVSSRTACIAPAETAHRSITPGHLAYVSQELGVPLQWDPVAQSVPDNNEAMKLLLSNPYRPGYTL